MSTHLLGDSVKLTPAQRDILATLGRVGPLRCPRCGGDTRDGLGGECGWCQSVEAAAMATERMARVYSARRRARAQYCRWGGMEC